VESVVCQPSLAAPQHLSLELIKCAEGALGCTTLCVCKDVNIGCSETIVLTCFELPLMAERSHLRVSIAT
jgi:hypothetical protein